MNHVMHFRNRTGKIFVLLLTLMLAFTTLAWNMLEAYAADEAIAEASKPAEEPQPSEEPSFPSVVPETSETMQTAEADGAEYSHDEVIVKFKGMASDSAIMSTLDAAGSEVMNTLEADGLTVADVPEGKTVESFIDELEAQPNVEYAQPNYVYHIEKTANDPYLSLQWHLNKINAFGAWDMTMGSPDIKVAVLDTGIDLSHPEFSGQIYAQADTVDNDGNANDTVDGHGTHVAGIIAGKADNSEGIAGVAPGVKLIIVDVFDGDDAYTSDIITGIQFALSNGASIINMSLGGAGNDPAFHAAIDNANATGVLCVVAAGNEHTSAPSYPSDYDSVVSVIATDDSDNKADFSNYGDTKDISAPGVDILSTYPSAIFSSGYAFADGTSMASPVVAGVAALMLSENPDLTVNEVKNILYNTAVDLGTAGKDNLYGYGRVDAYDAVQEASQYYDVTVSSSLIGGTGSSYGTATGGGNFTSCTPVTVSANAADHYHFVRWSESGTQVSTDPSYTFNIKKDMNLTANFELDWYTISVAANDSSLGSVSGGGKTYYGEFVTLIATPNDNCFFAGWRENGTIVSTNPTYTFTATKSTNIEAVFRINSFTVSLTPNNKYFGSVSGSGTYAFGSVVTLQASPFPKFRFIRWTENGNEVSRDQNYKITVLNNMSLVAEFALLTPITINYTITDATYYNGSDGTITASASGGDSGTYEYSLNGANWQSSNVFGGLRAGTYTVVARDPGYPSNAASRTVTVGQPPYMGTVPASKLSTKQNTDTALTIIPPVPPRGYTTQSVSFTSSNPSVAVVDANGNVTFLTGGKVTIITKIVSQTTDKKGRVKTKTTTFKKTITVNQPVSEISLNMGDTAIARTQKVKLIPSFTPATASNKKIRWISSNPKVAAVSSAGVVTGKAGGTAVIICSAQDGSGVSASCTVNVTPIYPTGVKVSKTALTMKLGKAASLKATVMPKTTDFKTVTWASSNPAVVSVDAKGKLKATSPGTAVITAATSSGQTAACTVTVN